MSARIIALFVGFLAIVTLFASTYIVDETQSAIITRFGEFRRQIETPGLYLKVPFAESVQRMDRRIIGSDTPPAEYLTLDKKRLLADPVTRWQIVDPLLFFKSVHDEAGAKARLADIINSELRRELASHNFGDIIGNARDPMMDRVAATAREKTTEFGIHIVDVRIKRADLPKEVQGSVFARMQAEREKVAKGYRSEGEEEAAKIRAETDKTREILLAEASKKAKTRRGEGDAQGISIYADAYNKDPEFYAFTRSLESYEKAMDEKSQLVLSTRSPLFKYLVDPEAQD
jgi:modulator of FtsH protease HflC